MGQPPPTVRDTLKARLQRLKDKKQRLVNEQAACQVELDAVKAELDGLTVADEDKLARLQQLAVIKAED